MKHLVNGVPAELVEAPDVEISSIDNKLLVKSQGKTYSAVSIRRGDITYVSLRGRVYEVAKVKASGSADGGANSAESRAPMPGQIVELSAQVNEVVTAGTKLMVLEAMKMQQPITAQIAGTVATVNVAVGDQVTDGQLLVVITPEDS